MKLKFKVKFIFILNEIEIEFVFILNEIEIEFVFILNEIEIEFVFMLNEIEICFRNKSEMCTIVYMNMTDKKQKEDYSDYLFHMIE